MRIPVFRSQAQPSSDAPGRPITARMRAEPFVRAEMQKGDVIGEAFDQLQQYALMRHKSAVEVQMSESLLAAEEEMRTLASRLEQSSDIYNVFKPDGSGLWSDNVNDMRERLADSIESRSARNEFRARFNQSELTKRFQLRGAIDSRIQARANAAAAARMQAIEDELSNPFGPTPDDYEIAAIGIRGDQDAAIRNGTASPEMAGTARFRLAENIATRTTQSYVFDDPTRAVALAEALDLQDEVRAGRMTAEEAYAQSGLADDAAYTLYTLDALPREQALEIIYDTLSRSNRLYEAAERRRTEIEEAQNAAIDRAYRGMFIFADKTKEFDFGDLMMAAPSVAATYSARLAIDGVSVASDTPITADEARTAFMDYFDARNYLTPTQRREIDTAFNRPTASSFATETNQDVYTDLFSRAEAGTLTVAGLNAARMSITPDNYTTLLSKIGAEADDALVDAKSVVQLRFGYNERMAMDSDAARQSQAAYFNVAAQLEQMATTRRAEGNPMTRAELNEEATRLANEQLELFRLALREERNQYIALQMENIPIGDDDPLADLEAWWNSLDPVEQRQRSSDYARHRLTLFEYQSRMNR